MYSCHCILYSVQTSRVCKQCVVACFISPEVRQIISINHVIAVTMFLRPRIVVCSLIPLKVSQIINIFHVIAETMFIRRVLSSVVLFHQQVGK